MAKRRVAAAFSTLLLTIALWPTAHAVAAGGSSELIAAVKNVSTQSDKLRSMMSNLNAGQFHVVNAQSVLSASDEAAFKASVKKNATDISDLRDTLTHTTVTGADGVVVPLRKVLQSKNVSIDQVIGVYVGSDGQITLFYQ
jgi:hypothetical protein